MKTAGVVKNSGHCIYSIGLECFRLEFLKLPYAVSFSVLHIYTYIYVCVYDSHVNNIISMHMCVKNKDDIYIYVYLAGYF